MFTVIEGKYRIPRFKFLFSIHHITALSSGTDIKKKNKSFFFFYHFFADTGLGFSGSTYDNKLVTVASSKLLANEWIQYDILSEKQTT